MTEEKTIKEIATAIREVNDANGWSIKADNISDHRIAKCDYIVPAKHGLIHTEITELEKVMWMGYHTYRSPDRFIKVKEEMADIIIQIIDLSTQLPLVIDTPNDDGISLTVHHFWQNNNKDYLSETCDRMRRAHKHTTTDVKPMVSLLRNDVDNALEKYRNRDSRYPCDVVGLINRVIEIYVLYTYVFDEFVYNNMDLYNAVMDKIEKNRERAYKHGKRC